MHIYADPIPINGHGIPQFQMTAVLYPGWGISPKGRGFVVTEEFRTHTVLTMLASLGGLWTILSAVFAWLFGRSLLFPLFGKQSVLSVSFFSHWQGSITCSTHLR